MTSSTGVGGGVVVGRWSVTSGLGRVSGMDLGEGQLSP